VSGDSPTDRRTELRRKAVHVGSVVFALALRWLTPIQAALAAGSALLFNLLLLHRVSGRSLLRPHEHARGFSWGIVLYPAAVLALIVVFARRLELAAAAWGLLAVGDGMAAVVGTLAGGPSVPWNPRKRWIGLVAFAATVVSFRFVSALVSALVPVSALSIRSILSGLFGCALSSIDPLLPVSVGRRSPILSAPPLVIAFVGSWWEKTGARLPFPRWPENDCMICGIPTCGTPIVGLIMLLLPNALPFPLPCPLPCPLPPGVAAAVPLSANKTTPATPHVLVNTFMNPPPLNMTPE
jgi:dolichol kinase